MQFAKRIKERIVAPEASAVRRGVRWKRMRPRTRSEERPAPGQEEGWIPRMQRMAATAAGYKYGPARRFPAGASARSGGLAATTSPSSDVVAGLPG